MGKVQLQVKLKSVEEHPPQYANFASVGLISGDIIIDFGILDPYIIAESQNEGSEERVVEAKIVARIAMNRENASRLVELLRQKLEEAGE